MAVALFCGDLVSGFHRDRHLRQQCARLGSATEGELLQFLLQGSVGLLSAGEVAGGQALANLVQILEQRILAARVRASPSTAEMVAMMEVAVRELGLALQILDGG